MAESEAIGGYDDAFVDEIDEDLQCQICQLPLKEPMQTKCGHRYCKQCLGRLAYLVLHFYSLYGIEEPIFASWLG